MYIVVLQSVSLSECVKSMQNYYVYSNQLKQQLADQGAGLQEPSPMRADVWRAKSVSGAGGGDDERATQGICYQSDGDAFSSFPRHCLLGCDSKFSVKLKSCQMSDELLRGVEGHHSTEHRKMNWRRPGKGGREEEGSQNFSLSIMFSAGGKRGTEGRRLDSNHTSLVN